MHKANQTRGSTTDPDGDAASAKPINVNEVQDTNRYANEGDMVYMALSYRGHTHALRGFPPRTRYPSDKLAQPLDVNQCSLTIAVGIWGATLRRKESSTSENGKS